MGFSAGERTLFDGCLLFVSLEWVVSVLLSSWARRGLKIDTRPKVYDTNKCI